MKSRHPGKGEKSMESASIKPGDKLTIGRTSRDGSKHFYESGVDTILSDCLLIYTPMFKGDLVRLPAGDEYEFLFYAQDGLYRSKGTISKYLAQNKVYLMQIKIRNLKRTQRRDFYRLDVAFDFTFARLMQPEEQEESGGASVYQGTARNLSGGGMRFESEAELRKEEHIQCSLILKDIFMTVEGKVLDVRPCENTQGYRYRVEFVNLESSLKDKIIQYICDKQREIFNKEKKVKPV